MPSSSVQRERLVIIGSGPAGYAAAIYGARALLNPLTISGIDAGGQLMTTTDVENYPGFEDAIQGPDLMARMRAQAERVGARFLADHALSVDLSARPFAIATDAGARFACDALIIATGAKAKWLGLPSEARFRGYGVSACATCDGFFYRGKSVAVLGGGNTAVEEALYLSHIAAHVTLVHRRDALRAEKIMQERLFAAPNVTVLFERVAEEIGGGDAPLAVTHLDLRNVRTGAIERIAADGVFVAIGHEPASELFVGQLAMKPNRYIQVEPGTARTSVPGVFAAGDVADDVYRQAITAAGMGCMAALEAERWLARGA